MQFYLMFRQSCQAKPAKKEDWLLRNIITKSFCDLRVCLNDTSENFVMPWVHSGSQHHHET